MTYEQKQAKIREFTDESLQDTYEQTCDEIERLGLDGVVSSVLLDLRQLCEDEMQRRDILAMEAEDSQEESVMSKAEQLFDSSKEILTGAAIGTAYGAAVSGLCVVQSCVEIGLYPLYMANCAVRPFVRLTAPLWAPPLMGALGAIAGAGVKIAKDL